MKSEKKTTKRTVVKQSKSLKNLPGVTAKQTKKAAVKSSVSSPPQRLGSRLSQKAPRKLQAPAKRVSLAIPPLLLEGDHPSIPPLSGPGQRYALGPTPPEEHFQKPDDLGELPEAYGTERILLAARDPHWLYASWDLTREQQRRHNSRSVDGHLIVRIYVNSLDEKLIDEVHVHPESRNWFIHVGNGGTKYVADLGYVGRDGRWTRVSTSRATVTPSDTLSDDTAVQFATIPPEVSFETLLELITSAVGENVPLAEAVQQLRLQGHRLLPSAPPASPKEWTPAQARALAEVVSMDSVRRVWMGSLEITELIRRHLEQGISSATAAQISLATQARGAISSVSMPSAERGKGKGFWFNINAEIVLYGATEPDAKASIGGREIKLRPDGTFSYRFALPDGQYDLLVKAISADQEDGRLADLHFGRETQYHGHVGAHPQEGNLKVPSVANVV